MNKPTTIILTCIFCFGVASSHADSDNRSGFGFGMGSSTPERNGNNYGWGFGSAEDYRDRRHERDAGVEQSSTRGGMSWGNGRHRYGNTRPAFSFGSRRSYGPPPQWNHPAYGGYYPPPGQPYWHQYRQAAPQGQNADQ